MSGNSELFARKSKSLFGGSLYAYGINVDTERESYFLAHLGNVRRKLWCLSYYCCIYVYGRISRGVESCTYAAQKLKAVCILVLCIVVGKELSDVSKCRRTQKCI